MPHRIKYPNGLYVRQNFDNQNRLIFAGQDDGTDTNLLAQFASYAYNGDSTRQNIVRGNGVRTDYTYETPVTGRIHNINHYVPGTPARTISSRTYGYDELDRMRWYQKSSSTQTNPLENGRGESYGYDQAGQLVSAAYEVTNPSGVNVPNDAFAYDNAGNFTTINGAAYTLNSTGLNQYGTAGSYGAASYDTRGNMKTLGAFSANYDALNEMTSGSYNGSSVSFAYDPIGRCVKRTVNGTASYLYYNGWNLIEEDNSAGAAQLLYVHGPATDELAAMWSASSNSWNWYHYDARGSVTHLTNASGQVVEQYSYSAFGFPFYYNGSGTQLAASAINNRFLFQGRDWIKELVIYDFRNRMYQPGIGRFLQADPLSLEAGDQNIYRFCNNDPINGSDPLGLEGDYGSSFGFDPSTTEFDPVTTTFSYGLSGSGYFAANEAFLSEVFGSSPSSSSSWQLFGGNVQANASYLEQIGEWHTGKLAARIANHQLTLAAMNHADGTVSGDWDLTQGEINRVRANSAYQRVQESLRSAMLKEYTGAADGVYELNLKTFSRYLFDKKSDDTRWAIGSARFTAWGHVTITDGLAVFSARIWMHDYFDFSTGNVEPGTPTWIGRQLQKAGYLHPFHTTASYNEVVSAMIR